MALVHHETVSPIDDQVGPYLYVEWDGTDPTADLKIMYGGGLDHEDGMQDAVTRMERVTGAMLLALETRA